MKAFLLIALGIGLIGTPSTLALTPAEAITLRIQFLNVPRAEMPAQAAKLLLKAKPRDRYRVATLLIRLARERHNAVTAQIVASMIQAVPEMREPIGLFLDASAASGQTRARSLAADPAPTGTVDSYSTPINPISGGNGSGSFDGAFVNPVNPEVCPCVRPGSCPCDYTEPRDI